MAIFIIFYPKDRPAKTFEILVSDVDRVAAAV